VATERLDEFTAIHPEREAQPDPSAVYPVQADLDRQQALVELLRSRLSGLGPVTVETLADDFQLSQAELEQALIALQTEGYAIRMSPPQTVHESRSKGRSDDFWCERRLLARIHRYSRERRRKAARAVSPATYMRFLLDWHGLG